MYKDFKEMRVAIQGMPPKTISISAAEEEHIVDLALELTRLNICNVILVGNENEIRKIADNKNTNLSGIKIIDEKDNIQSAYIAVGLVHDKKADVVVKGKINTSDFLHAVLDKEIGLRTGRRLCTLTCYDVPEMEKLFFITDGGMNIAPDLEAKVDILQSTVPMLHNFGIEEPKVAILSANEKVSEKMPSTVDAQKLCEMAERGELPKGIYEGPIAFDVAMRPEAARIKGINSKISGNVDLFLVPNIETGNCLGKAIGFFGKGEAAVIVAGAKAPVVMTSRAASVNAKLNAVIFALLTC